MQRDPAAPVALLRLSLGTRLVVALENLEARFGEVLRVGLPTQVTFRRLLVHDVVWGW